MHKVIVERPRWTPGPGKYARRANLSNELLPKFEGMKRIHGQRKGQRDLLGPLRRWLQAQVGRPWNDVYSEACAVIHPHNYVRVHVKTHLLQYVERNTFMHNGEVCVLSHWPAGIQPITAERLGRSVFYVHPESGRLQELRPLSRRQWRMARIEKQQQTLRWLNPQFALKKIEGIWFGCHFRAISPYGPFKAHDHALGQAVGRGGLVRREGVYFHCITKRQLSKPELRRYGVSNEHRLERSLQQITIGLLTSALRSPLFVRVAQLIERHLLWWRSQVQILPRTVRFVLTF